MKLYKSLATARERRNEVEYLKLSLKDEQFPEELFDFSHLKELYLEGACTRLPDFGEGWKELRVLSIKWPFFGGDLSRLFSLPALENLKLIETPLKSLILPLGNHFSPLKSLTIKSCGLSELPSEISDLIQLQELNLSQNKLASLPLSFVELRNLQRLNLDQNCFEVFPEQFRRMSRLKHLSIDGNRFSEEERARIQREFHITPI